jgi:hypothetical protein
VAVAPAKAAVVQAVVAVEAATTTGDLQAAVPDLLPPQRRHLHVGHALRPPQFRRSRKRRQNPQLPSRKWSSLPRSPQLRS